MAIYPKMWIIKQTYEKNKSNSPVVHVVTIVDLAQSA